MKFLLMSILTLYPSLEKTTANFVPILGRLVDVSRPFIKGIFCGKGSDPSDLESFLHDFVEEVNELVAQDFNYGINTFKFGVRHYIFDQKARASIKRVKGCRGYYCCEKCTVKGINYMNRMVLLDQDCPLRSDESFVELVSSLMMPRREHYDDYEKDEHVIGTSPLLDCEDKLVSKFR